MHYLSAGSVQVDFSGFQLPTDQPYAQSGHGMDSHLVGVRGVHGERHPTDPGVYLSLNDYGRKNLAFDLFFPAGRPAPAPTRHC